MPSNTPLFPGGPFSWGDGVAVAFGVVGVVLLIKPLRDFIFQSMPRGVHFGGETKTSERRHTYYEDEENNR